MLVVLIQSFTKPRRLVVVHSMFLANFFDDGLNIRMMAVVDAREQMVLNLEVESTGE